MGSPRKTSDGRHSPHCWVIWVRIFPYTYILVSAGDPAGGAWCAIDGALKRLETVDQYSRWGIKYAAALHSRLVEAETAIRHEWHRLTRQDKSITIDDAVELARRVSQVLRLPVAFFFISFYSYEGRDALFPSVIGRNVAQ